MNPDHTPPRSFKPPPHVYARAQEEAERRGETITEVLVRALRRYGKTPKEKGERI